MKVALVVFVPSEEHEANALGHLRSIVHHLPKGYEVVDIFTVDEVSEPVHTDVELQALAEIMVETVPEQALQAKVGEADVIPSRDNNWAGNDVEFATGE